MKIGMKVSGSSALSNMSKLIKEAPKQAMFAAVVANTRVAGMIREELTATMARVFDRPTSMVLQSVRVKPASKQDPVAVVGLDIRELGGKNIKSMKEIIGHHFVGGERVQKRLEMRLQRLGVLPVGRYVAPGRGAPLDAHGNISRGEVGKMLTQMGSYDVSRMSGKTFERLKKDKKLVGRGKYNGRTVLRSQYFVAKSKSGRPLGVWKVMGRGDVQPVLAFVAKPTYRKRIDLPAIGQRVIAKCWPQEFRKALADALKNSNHKGKWK